MTLIHYDGETISLDDAYSVLEGMEGAGIRIPYSCRVGVCQSCILQTDDAVPIECQQGLRPQQVAQGYFLSCCCYPHNDLTIKAKTHQDDVKGCVVDKKSLDNNVCILLVEVDFSWIAGQYIYVRHQQGAARPYSIASRCDSPCIIELHVKRHDKGLVSRWLCDDVAIGDVLDLSLPNGDCIYTKAYYDSPLILVGTGTGLAPLYGILQDALYYEHEPDIYFYVAGSDPASLYYQGQLKSLSERHPNLHYSAVVKRNSSPGQLQGDVVAIVKERHSDMRGYKIFLCGSPIMVNALQRSCFFQSAKKSDIHIDAFEVANKK